LSLVDQVERAHVFILNLSGGEPLLRRDFFKILRYVSQTKVMPYLTTNATLIDRTTAARLKEGGLKQARVSLDGSLPDIHARLRGTEESFHRAVSGIKHLIEEGIPVTTISVISRHNFSDMENICDLCLSMSVGGVNFMPLIPGGRGKQLRDLVLSPNEYRDFLRQAERLSRMKGKKGLTILSEAPLQAVIRKTKGSGICCAASTFVFICEDGSVTPCSYFFEKVGSIRKSSLLRIWRHSAFLDDLCDEDMLAGECRSCKYSDSCFGGCRAAVYNAFGSISRPDPFCWISKDIGRRCLKTDN
jgi:radical SAM protein with 4Fe4S-binding SPASM domain